MLARVSQLTTRVREGLRDPLYRGSLVLLINTGVIAALGFAFWTLAAREYPATTVGSFSGLTSGIGLISTVASLGLPNMVTRHLASSDSPRGLLLIATAAIVGLGSMLCLIVLLGLGSFLPASLHLQAGGRSAGLLTALVIFTSLNGAWSAGMIVLRLPGVVLWTNLAGALTKLVLLFLLISDRSSGLIVAFGIGVLISACAGLPQLMAKAPWGNGMSGSFIIFREYLSVTVNNYIATIFGALPGAIMPLEVIARQGTAKAAPFALAYLLAGFLNIIPSTMSQLVFAESSRKGASLNEQVRKAIRGIYAILVPLLLIAVPAGPFILRIFGSNYSTAGGEAFRILALTTLLMSGNYLVDCMLIARDRSVAYLFMNAANAALVIGCVDVLLKHGITGAAEGWCLAQGLSLVLGLFVLALGRISERTVASPSDVALAPDEATEEEQGHLEKIRSRNIQIPTSVRATVPLMLGDLAGTEDLLRSLSSLSSGSRQNPYPMRPRQRFARPGEVVFFGLWFPPMTVPTGPSQVRIPRELPVLIAFSGYSGWLTALLIPSLQVPDVLAGAWELLNRLGGKPKHAVWDNNWMRQEVTWFFDSMGVNAIPAGHIEESMIQQMYIYLKERFNTGQAIYSPQQFNDQLERWVAADNRYPPGALNEPPTLLTLADRREMPRLPARSPAPMWRIDAYVQGKPFVHFDSNEYAVDPAVIGRKVLIVADLWYVDIYSDGYRVGSHRRSWAKGALVNGRRVHSPWQNPHSHW